MQFDFCTDIKNGRSQVIATKIDSGSGKGKMKFYTEPKPAAGAVVTTQTLLATVLFKDPCGTVANGALPLEIDGDVLVSVEGIIAWVRITNSDDVFAIDADVSNNAGTGAIKIDNTHVYVGGTIKVLSSTLTES